jgi:hypothetical protein
VINARSGADARTCGVRTGNAERTWRVVPLPVTRTLTPAAFRPGPGVAFITADPCGGDAAGSSGAMPAGMCPARPSGPGAGAPPDEPR